MDYKLNTEYVSGHTVFIATLMQRAIGSGPKFEFYAVIRIDSGRPPTIVRQSQSESHCLQALQAEVVGENSKY